MNIRGYSAAGRAYNEDFNSGRRARPDLSELARFMRKSSIREIYQRRHDAELAIRTAGITFSV